MPDLRPGREVVDDEPLQVAAVGHGDVHEEVRTAANTVGVTALAFPDLARAAATYAEFAAAMAATPAGEVHIHGLALLGPDRLTRGLTRGLRALGDPVTEAVR